MRSCDYLADSTCMSEVPRDFGRADDYRRLLNSVDVFLGSLAELFPSVINLAPSEDSLKKPPVVAVAFIFYLGSTLRGGRFFPVAFKCRGGSFGVLSLSNFLDSFGKVYGQANFGVGVLNGFGTLFQPSEYLDS